MQVAGDAVDELSQGLEGVSDPATQWLVQYAIQVFRDISQVQPDMTVSNKVQLLMKILVNYFKEVMVKCLMQSFVSFYWLFFGLSDSDRKVS